MKKFVLLFMAPLFLAAFSGCHKVPEKSQEFPSEEGTEPLKKITITVAYDNNPYDNRLRTAWGFSCVVKLEGKNILFDTGGDSPTLLSNMNQLKIDPRDVDVVVLSHIHGDHVGGLSGFLEKNSHLVVYLPKSFPQRFKNQVISYDARFEEVSKGRKLFDNIFTTGELGIWIKEQSLILNTTKGLVIITGCAHPGIVKIVEKSKQLVGGVPLLVMGGFHLGGTSKMKIKKIIADFKRLGVKQVGPCHCSGDRARSLFREAYGEHFVEVGVGKIITIGEYQTSKGGNSDASL